MTGCQIAKNALSEDSLARVRLVTKVFGFGVLVLLLYLCLTASARATSSHAECSNEELRSSLVMENSLPDCRLYEMISPPYKEGYPVISQSFATNGDKSILFSLGNLAGSLGAGESAQEATLYMATRTATGWSMSPLNPPLSKFVGQIPLVSEADSGRTLWIQHTPGQSPSTRDLYSRSAAGVYSLIGPISPPGQPEEESNVINPEVGSRDQPRAATDDYKHVVLVAEAPQVYWPFDGTAGVVGSLYEYSGSNNESPILVGVDGVKGSTHLIGLCGTELGAGGSGSAYNALSNDGEAIFFTVDQLGRFGCEASAPATAELYARLHGALSSPAPAETLNISKSECTSECGEAESGKNFEGASEDGQKVFFTSTQKLTNDAVDGTVSGNAAKGLGCAARPPEEGGCNLYEYDFKSPLGSRLTVISEGGEVLGVAGIAEDGARIYFVSRNSIANVGQSTYGKSPLAGEPNLYVYDTTSRKTAFIITLTGEGDEADWRREFVRPVEVAGLGGRYLLFASATPYATPDDNSSMTQLFEYKAEAAGEPAELVRISKGENNYNEDGNDVISGVDAFSIAGVADQLGNKKDFKSTANRLNVSADGATVFFETAGQLSPRAVSAAQGCLSMYEFHAEDAVLSRGVVRLVSDGRDVQLNKGVACGAEFEGMDGTGANALFSTADPLLPGDVDGVQRDVYDVRSNGGFPLLPETGRCGPSLCEGPSSTPHTLPVAGSAGTVGEEPLVSATRVGAGKRDSRVKSGRRFAQALKACQHVRLRHRTSCRRTARRRFGFGKKGEM